MMALDLNARVARTTNFLLSEFFSLGVNERELKFSKYLHQHKSRERRMFEIGDRSRRERLAGLNVMGVR